tara:strand:+ start:4059 stop:4295 length:237 start_codon:yes stop_codon:yes gene_type:complete
MHRSEGLGVFQYGHILLDLVDGGERPVLNKMGSHFEVMKGYTFIDHYHNRGGIILSMGVAVLVGEPRTELGNGERKKG